MGSEKMMTPKQVDRSALLLDALDGIGDVRSGLRCATNHGEMRLQLEAYEDQGSSGGMGYGSLLLPKDYGRELLKTVEQKLRAELKSLGVSP